MKTRLSLYSVVSLKEEVLFADLDEGEAAILSLRDGLYFGLNRVATRIWRLLEEGKRVVEVRDVLSKEFDVEEDRLTRDLIELIEQLAQQGLVEISPEAAA